MLNSHYFAFSETEVQWKPLCWAGQWAAHTSSHQADSQQSYLERWNPSDCAPEGSDYLKPRCIFFFPPMTWSLQYLWNEFPRTESQGPWLLLGIWLCQFPPHLCDQEHKEKETEGCSRRNLLQNKILLSSILLNTPILMPLLKVSFKWGQGTWPWSLFPWRVVGLYKVEEHFGFETG
jgi:hypothetical protein